MQQLCSAVTLAAFASSCVGATQVLRDEGGPMHLEATEGRLEVATDSMKYRFDAPLVADADQMTLVVKRANGPSASFDRINLLSVEMIRFSPVRTIFFVTGMVAAAGLVAAAIVFGVVLTHLRF
jgi:hypothetical protein